MKVEIIEIDRDYRCYSGSEWMEFSSKAEAEEYCRKQSWSGYSYMVGMVIEGK